MTLLAQGIEARADDAEVFGAGDRAEAARYFLLYLRHADCPFANIVSERNGKIADEEQYGVGMLAKASPQIESDGLLEVMVQREAKCPLQGDVSVDDAYPGGERTGGGPGRGSSNKVAFVAAVKMKDGRPQRVRFDPVAGFFFAALAPWAKQAFAPGCCVTSYGLLGFEVLDRLKYEHKVVQAPRGKAGTEIEPFKWLNVVLGNLKTALSGTPSCV